MNTELNDRIEMGEGDEDYRPLGLLSIVAFVLSFSAFLVVFVPATLLFAVIALVLGIVSYVRASNSAKSAPTSIKLSLAAVAISLSVSCFALTNATVRQFYVYGTAQKYAEQWLDMLQTGDFRRAHQLSLLKQARVNGPGEEHLDAYYDPEFVLMREAKEVSMVIKPKEVLDKFLLTEPQFTIKFGKDKSEAKYMGVDFSRYVSKLDHEDFGLLYELTPNPHDAKKPMTIAIVMQRRRDEDTADVQWTVRVVKVVDGGPEVKPEIFQM